MSLTKKIDFALIIGVKNANPNGDPLNGNRPRADFSGIGEMTDVCLKRKIRDRLQENGEMIFVQANERKDDGMVSLKNRYDGFIKHLEEKNNSQTTDLLGDEVETKSKKKTSKKDVKKDEIAKSACENWFDVRSFGQVFAFKNNEKSGVSVGVRGPVSIHQAVSISPVEIEEMQITKSVNGETGEKRSSDTMGTKHFVRFGFYEIKGAINVQLAEKTGFSDEDADTVKECLRTLFVNDASSARPDGSMEVVKLFWWRHSCKDGQYSSARVHRSVKVALRDAGTIPTAADDYVISLEALPGLEPEVIDGV